MPRYIKINGNGEPEKDMIFIKSWVSIPVESKNKNILSESKTYLVQKRVADYIVLLESKISGELPKLESDEN